MHRRNFLAAGGAAALGLPLLASTKPAAAQAVGTGDAALNALFDRIFDRILVSSPGFATSLGLDKGDKAVLRRTFDPKPYPESRAENVARLREALKALEAIPPASLSPAAAVNREIVLYDIQSQLMAPTRFDLDSAQGPYLISQQDGAYFSIPDFLDSTHPVETAADAEAYLSRLAEFPRILDFETAEQKRQAARGYVAPAWSLEMALGQIAKLREQPAESSGMVESLVRRTAEKKIAGDWGARAARIVDDEVYPALDRQAAALRALVPTTAPGDGATRLPNGAAIYAAACAKRMPGLPGPPQPAADGRGLAGLGSGAAPRGQLARGARRRAGLGPRRGARLAAALGVPPLLAAEILPEIEASRCAASMRGWRWNDGRASRLGAPGGRRRRRAEGRAVRSAAKVSARSSVSPARAAPASRRLAVVGALRRRRARPPWRRWPPGRPGRRPAASSGRRDRHARRAHRPGDRRGAPAEAQRRGHRRLRHARSTTCAPSTTRSSRWSATTRPTRRYPPGASRGRDLGRRDEAPRSLASGRRRSPASRRSRGGARRCTRWAAPRACRLPEPDADVPAQRRLRLARVGHEPPDGVGPAGRTDRADLGAPGRRARALRDTARMIAGVVTRFPLVTAAILAGTAASPACARKSTTPRRPPSPSATSPSGSGRPRATRWSACSGRHRGDRFLVRAAWGRWSMGSTGPATRSSTASGAAVEAVRATWTRCRTSSGRPWSGRRT